MNQDMERTKKTGLVRSLLFMIILAAAAAVAAWRIYPLNIVPVQAIGIVLANVVLLVILLFLTRRKTAANIILGIISMILAAVFVVVFLVVGRIDSTLQEVTADTQGQVSRVVIVVPSDSKIETPADLDNKEVSYPSMIPQSSITAITNKLKEKGAESIRMESYSGIVEAAEALMEEKTDAVILYAGYLDLLNEEYGEDFSEKIKTVYEVDVEEAHETNFLKKQDSNMESGGEENTEDVAGESGESRIEKLAGSAKVSDTYLIYISGIDTFGEVSTKSRSDVNILAAVNTKTHEIQLVNTPRDYFVELPISNGVKDKLTHAGLYGIDVSAGALEMLYDVDIDQYVRVNFSGFEEIIDALGGIDVSSDYDFTVEPIKHYTVGVNHLSGIEALAFARERHAFTDGDVQRGRNQMAVITAVINKMTSPAILTSFDEVMKGLSGSVQTSFTNKEIYALVRDQLVSGETWKVESFTVTGTGANQTTYSMPGTTAYVMEPDEEVVKEAEEQLNDVLDKDK